MLIRKLPVLIESNKTASSLSTFFLSLSVHLELLFSLCVKLSSSKLYVLFMCLWPAVELCLPSKYTYVLIQLFHPACDGSLWLLMSIASDDSDVSG